MISSEKTILTEKLQAEMQLVETFLQAELAKGVPEFRELLTPLIQAGGKRLRAQVCLLIGGAKGGDVKTRVALAAAIEMLHLATLIHDDVLDQAALRRGTEPIHCSHGNKVAILSGDYLFARAFAIVAEIGSVDCLRVFSTIIASLVEGEFLQMQDAYALHQSIERYLHKTCRKTADFIEAALEIGGIVGGWSIAEIDALKRYGHALGMAFQITDDLMDYRESTQTTGKPVGKDLREGLLTYPLLSIVNEANRSYIEGELRKIYDGGDVKPLLAYVAEAGGLQKTLALSEQYVNEAHQALGVLPDFRGKEILVQAIETLGTRKV